MAIDPLMMPGNKWWKSFGVGPEQFKREKEQGVYERAAGNKGAAGLKKKRGSSEARSARWEVVVLCRSTWLFSHGTRERREAVKQVIQKG